MLPNTGPTNKKIVLGLVIVASALMIAVIPFIAFKMVNPIIGYQLERIAQFMEEGNAKYHLLTLTTWLVSFFVFMMLGVSAAENFANGHAAFRILYGHPKRPMFAEGISITYFGWLGLWVSFGLLVAAIYQLGVRNKTGWYLALIGGAVGCLVIGATHYVRHATIDYLPGSLMGLSIVIMMLIPLFKKRLLEEYPE